MLSNLDRTPAVKHLLIINISVFVLMFFIPQINNYFDLFSLHYFDEPSFGIWQMVTHMFLHGGIMHLAFNMIGLFQFGSILEQHWGTKRFILFYFFAGIGGAIFYNLDWAAIFYYLGNSVIPFTEGLYNGTIPSAVGASGAIVGVVVVFALLHPNTELMLMFVPIPVKAKYLVSAFLIWDIFMGLRSTLSAMSIVNGASDGVAHFAHIGGAIFGLILFKFWQKDKSRFY